MKKNEARSAAAEALNMVGLPEKYYEYSPYDLSGGEKKRAAIAGILAYKPELLIMDEPVAGLDPAGRKELFELIRYLNKQKVTIIIVSHDMNDVYELADRLLVMNNGSLVYDGDVEKCLSDKDMLSAYSLKQPELIKLKKYLEADVTLRSRTVPELIHEIKEQIYLP
jgi:energy-coupling factor transport system ATP-binding protein